MSEAMLPFDDRDGVIWFDGALVPWREARIHVLTHGLHYGSCVFEGERIYDGEPFRLRSHTQRLIASGRTLGFELPYDEETLVNATREAVQAMGVSSGYVRPLAWRGSEVMGVEARRSRIHVAIAVWAWPSYFSAAAKEHGIRLTMARWRRPAPNTAPTTAKAAGLYMICTLSKHEAEAAGFDDAVMLDYRGRVAESTGSNLFLVQDGVLVTPEPDCFLNGITRQEVIKLAKARQIKVEERAVWPEEFARAQEVFLTGTAVEITPVGEVAGRIFPVGPVTRALMEDFARLVHGEDSAA